MRSYEQVYNLFWIFLAVGIGAESMRLKVWDSSSGPIAGFIPLLAGALIGISGLLMFFLGGSKKSEKDGRERFWPDRAGTRRIVSILAGLCAMAYLLPILGFLITSIIVTAFLLRVIEPQKWVTVICTSLGCCVLVYWLFNHFLQVSLPKGFLGF
jgi:putative tricarboxylic transport membrane protein